MLERFTPVVEAESDRLAAALRPGDDLRSRFAGRLAAAIVTHALGLHAVGVEAVLRWYSAIVAAVTELTAGRPLPRSGEESFAALREAMLRSADGDSLFADAARGLKRPPRSAPSPRPVLPRPHRSGTSPSSRPSARTPLTSSTPASRPRPPRRIGDLETGWDQAQARLKVKDKTAWTEIDDKIDTALRELRSTSPNIDDEKAALTALLVSLH